MEPLTRTLARRWLKSRMRLAICRAKAEEDPDIWTPMTFLAESFEREARKEWRDHAKGKTRERLLPHVIEALNESASEATLPYKDKLPTDWLDQKVQEFMESFDLGSMIVDDDE
jgi:hypothetical protein